jgi:hypothetical protein
VGGVKKRKGREVRKSGIKGMINSIMLLFNYLVLKPS